MPDAIGPHYMSYRIGLVGLETGGSLALGVVKAYKDRLHPGYQVASPRLIAWPQSAS